MDRLVRVVSGKETVVRLWRASGDFAAVDATVTAGLPLDLGSGLLAVGDFDNNGSQDVASLSAAGLRVFLSTAGAFKAQTVSAAMVTQSKTLWTQNVAELEVADLNGDGLLDLVCNYTVAGAAQPGRIGAFVASGAADATGRRSWGTTGGFTEFREVQSYSWAKPVFSLADANSDGLTDLVVLETNGRAPEDTGSRRPVHVYLNRWKTNAASPFSEILNHGIVGGNELAKFQVVDVNGDGKLDLVNGSAAEGSVEPRLRYGLMEPETGRLRRARRPSRQVLRSDTGSSRKWTRTLMEWWIRCGWERTAPKTCRYACGAARVRRHCRT